ncbi:hypothetical protein N656DRAFT_783080 [Canariomyces notabilis]|uniref:Uncharacterized protein n=1 Tax=Canariomyces notabilis TaxID=2074819 RepID=A0AAN6T982_9PEZI|nr:hypothetical protein N656DRAFT_783080 [Canariomyces arenarius]
MQTGRSSARFGGQTQTDREKRSYYCCAAASMGCKDEAAIDHGAFSNLDPSPVLKVPLI